jgi:hypothetical protein
MAAKTELHYADLPFRVTSKTKAATKQFLSHLFLSWLSPYLRNRIKYVPRTSHTNTLGTFEAFAQEGLGKQGMALAVGDGSGEYRLSEIAARHWIAVGLAAIAAKRTDFTSWVASYGLAIEPELSLASLLKTTDHPLVEVTFEGKPWLVCGVRGKAAHIITDVGVGPQSATDLDAKGRAALARVARTGVCECQLCSKLRAKR